MTSYLESGGAIVVEVASAPWGAAGAVAAGGLDLERQVVTIHQTDVVEIVAVGAVEGELGQGGRGIAARSFALENASTVPCLARAFPGAIEFAPYKSTQNHGRQIRIIEGHTKTPHKTHLSRCQHSTNNLPEFLLNPTLLQLLLWLPEFR